MTTSRTASPDTPFPLEQVLSALLFLAALLVLSLPGARAASAGFGWTPLWLLALPSAGLAVAFALRRLRRDAEPAAAAPIARRRRTLAAAPGRRRSAERGAALRLQRISAR